MTDSIEELARFWDSHDLTDFAADLEEVAEPVFERRPAVPVGTSETMKSGLESMRSLSETMDSSRTR